VKFQ
jgi:hypothetical protein